MAESPASGSRAGYFTARPGVVTPVLGRGFTAEEDSPGGPAAVLLSDGLWRRRFGADPAVIGRVLTLDEDSVPRSSASCRRAFSCLPTMPARHGRCALPLDPAINRSERGRHFLEAYRPAPRRRDAGGGAARDVQRSCAACSAAYPTEYTPDFDGSATSVSQEVVGDVRPALLVLLGAVALLLLIACANVANLLRSPGPKRGSGRSRVRAALGAGRSRLVRQLLTESLLLAVAGGLLGLLLAVWGVDLLLAAPASRGVPRRWGSTMRVLGYTLGVTVLTGILFGLAPALHALRADPPDR